MIGSVSSALHFCFVLTASPCFTGANAFCVFIIPYRSFSLSLSLSLSSVTRYEWTSKTETLIYAIIAHVSISLCDHTYSYKVSLFTLVFFMLGPEIAMFIP